MSATSINLKNIQAVIFDFDGVIVDTEHLHYRSFVEILRKYGMDYVTFEEHCREFGGRGSRYIITHYVNKYQKNLNISKLIGEKVNLFVELSNQSGVEQIKGVVEFASLLKEKNVKVGISTGSNKKTVDHILNLAKIPKMFDIITTADDIKKPKPDPEGFLVTAKKLNVDPKDCLIFEDAINGIQAAKSANMKYIAVASCISEEKFKELDSNIQIIKNFTEVNLI